MQGEQTVAVLTHSGVVFHGTGDLRVEQVVITPPREGEVILEVELCAICGSDFKAWKKGNPRLKPPMTLGHEFCGRLVALGRGVKGYRLGQRVTMATTIGCGVCRYCTSGRTNLCRSATAMGFHHHGAMTRWMKVPASAVRQKHLVDVGDLAAEVAALAEPMSCVINNLSRVPEGALGSVVIVGLGPLGVLHAIAARARGVRCVVGVDPSAQRRGLASRFGFDAVCHPDAVREQIDGRTGGDGFDLVVVTAPAPAAQAGAIDLACKGGYVSLFGSLPVGEEMLTLSSRTIHYGELNVYGSSDSTVEHVKQAVAVLRSMQATARAMVTHILPLDEFDEAMRLMASGEGLKVALRPSL